MVIFWALLLFFIPFELQAQGWQEVKVTAEVDQEKLFENQAFKGLISITHDKSLQVDKSSFTVDEKPLSAEFVQDVEVSPPHPLIISYYRFTLPGQPAGLYLLPEVRVNVGGKAYSSIPVTYAVEAASAAEPIHPQKESKSKPKEAKKHSTAFLKLQVSTDGTQTLYPGQRFRVSYRYLFNQNIELSEEQLPLLEPQGFVKVGTKEVKSSQEKDVTVQEISQVLEATKPGKYVIPASHISGYVYQTDSFGNVIYQKPALEATEKEMTLTVSPFPAKGKPASFNGAIGPFDHFTASLKSPSSLYVGDKIDLDIEIGGTGQVDNVPLPELCCQPGFSGLFKLSDLPPASELKNQIRHFSVEMRPLTDSIKNVPSIEFSYFMPQEGSYDVLRSESIPIKVSPVPVVPKEESPSPSKKEETAGPKVSTQPAKIEISGNMPMTTADLYNRPFGTWAVLYLIPFGVFGIIFLVTLRRYLLMKKTQVKPKLSQDYFNEALQAPPTSPQFYHLLNKAFRLKLVDKKLIKEAGVNFEDLPASGVVEEVRNFLRSLEEKRFTGHEKTLGNVQIEEARKLFKKLDHEVPS
jgi:hypothetical protein